MDNHKRHHVNRKSLLTEEAKRQQELDALVSEETHPLESPPVPARQPQRRDDRTMTRRSFAVGAAGLVGLATVGGVSGWYLLKQRLAAPITSVPGGQGAHSAIRAAVNNTRVLIFSGHTASVNALAWSPDGQLIASASDDASVQIFRVSNGQRTISYTGHAGEVVAVDWSPGGQRIASGGQDATVQIWQATSGAKILTYTGHASRVNAVSWSNDGQSIASGSDDASVQVWDAANSSLNFNFVGATSGVLCAGWQPGDGSVAAGSWDGSLRDWATIRHGTHFAAGNEIFHSNGHGINEVNALVWSPQGSLIASAGADQVVQIASGRDGASRPPFFTGHKNQSSGNRVLAVSWSPDGTSIASGDSAGKVYVWRVADRKTFFSYSGHKGAVNTLAWSPDGKSLASGSADNTVQVWQPG